MNKNMYKVTFTIRGLLKPLEYQVRATSPFAAAALAGQRFLSDAEAVCIETCDVVVAVLA